MTVIWLILHKNTEQCSFFVQPHLVIALLSAVFNCPNNVTERSKSHTNVAASSYEMHHPQHVFIHGSSVGVMATLQVQYAAVSLSPLSCYLGL